MRIHPMFAGVVLFACVDPSSPAEDASTTTAATTGDPAPTTGGTEPGSTGEPTTAGPTTDPSGDAPWTPASCYDGWDELAAFYPDAGALVDCQGDPAGFAVQRSLLVVDGITIDNNGAAMQPCVEARCDADNAYIASNDLPHYDFVQTTPNALQASETVLRIPLAPAPPGDAVAADAPEVQEGCVDAYDQHVDAPDQSTPREPSGLCVAAATDAAFLRETLASGETVTTAKLACLGTTAVMISGVVVAGPNEAQMPDPYGNPLFYMPNTAGEPYLGDDLMAGAALDLCGGHTGMSMHYHGANAACFAQAADGTPAQSYAEASQAWDLDEMLQGPCEAPSPVLGWSPDGYPIKGPCVCADADCSSVVRARSSWVYAGLGGWGDDPEAGDLETDGTACTVDADCCEGADCDYRCAPVVVADDGPAGTAVASRCALLDYSWCTHRFVDRSTHAGGAGFVYLDRCNGRLGPDGYAYHATASFPYFQACYHGAPARIPGPGMMMGDDGGMNPPMCTPGQMMCCGDAVCDGPETAMNCPEDCG